MDRLLALALTTHEAGLCGDCGQQMSYSMDPANEERWTTLPHPYRCYACTAIARRAKEYVSQPFPQALRFVPGLRAGPEDAAH